MSLLLAPFFAALAAAASPLLEAKLRGRVAALYERLETPSLRLEADTSRIPASLTGPAWASRWSLERDGGTRPGGAETATLVWKSEDGGRIRRDWIQVRVRRDERVPVARGRLQRGERLDSSRLSWEWRRTDGMRVQPPAIDSVDKFRTRTGISPGQVVWRSQLERLPVFLAGEPVRILAGNRGASASVEGSAIDDGIPGSTVRVRSPFGKTLVGTTESDGSVIVR